MVISMPGGGPTITVSYASGTWSGLNDHRGTKEETFLRCMLDAMEILTGEPSEEPLKGIDWETKFLERFLRTVEEFKDDYLELEKTYESIRTTPV